jgi:hypothetical protein
MTSASTSARNAASNLFNLVGEKPAASTSGAALKAAENDVILDMRYGMDVEVKSFEANIVPCGHTL